MDSGELGEKVCCRCVKSEWGVQGWSPVLMEWTFFSEAKDGAQHSEFDRRRQVF